MFLSDLIFRQNINITVHMHSLQPEAVCFFSALHIKKKAATIIENAGQFIF
jgi:hypothetical protein